jgi:hypothetical protein
MCGTLTSEQSLSDMKLQLFRSLLITVTLELNYAILSTFPV